MSRRHLFPALAALPLLAACAAGQPGAVAPTIGEVAQDTGYGRYAPLPRSAYDRALAERVAVLAAAPMCAEDAVEIGLLAHPEVRGLLQEFGVQRPGTVARLGEAGDAAAPAEWRLIDLVMTRRNLRGEEDRLFRNSWTYGEMYADIAHEVLEAANEIRRTYYEAVAAKEVAAMHDRLLDAAQATAELAGEQYRSGTASRLEQTQRQLAYLDTHKHAVAAKREAVAKREALNAMLRLPLDHAGWALPDRLPELPAERPVIENVEAVALRNRPEALSAGVRDVASPLGASIAAETRDAYTRMLVAYDTARFQREAVLPVAQAMLQEMQLHYNAMLEDVYALIEAGQANVEAGREYVEAAAGFWIAHAELADMLGGRLPDSPPPAAATAAPASSPSRPGEPS